MQKLAHIQGVGGSPSISHSQPTDGSEERSLCDNTSTRCVMLTKSTTSPGPHLFPVRSSGAEQPLILLLAALSLDGHQQRPAVPYASSRLHPSLHMEMWLEHCCSCVEGGGRDRAPGDEQEAVLPPEHNAISPFAIVVITSIYLQTTSGHRPDLQLSSCAAWSNLANLFISQCCGL